MLIQKLSFSWYEWSFLQRSKLNCLFYQVRKCFIIQKNDFGFHYPISYYNSIQTMLMIIVNNQYWNWVSAQCDTSFFHTLASWQTVFAMYWCPSALARLSGISNFSFCFVTGCWGCLKLTQLHQSKWHAKYTQKQMLENVRSMHNKSLNWDEIFNIWKNDSWYKNVCDMQIQRISAITSSSNEFYQDCLKEFCYNQFCQKWNWLY